MVRAMRTLLVVAVVVGCSGSPAPSSTAPPTGPRPPDPVAAAPDPTPPAFRLPGDVRPVKYGLDLTIVPELATATGKVHVDARVVRPTRVVWLHAEGLTIQSAQLGGVAARVIMQPQMIGLVADRELAAGEVAIDVAFTTPMDKTRSRGLYTEKEGADTYAYTFFEPIDARRAFPCFDEPAYKVPWQLTFHVKADHVALANAPVVRESPERDGMKRVELAESKPLPSYLVAYVVGPFELVDGGTAGRIKTPVRFIIPKGRSAELAYAKQVTPRVVAALEDYFDMDYPYGKLDVAVVPRFWGTMEHPGIVAMGQPLTLIRPDQETRSRKERYTNILAHELAHYWFGDVVTMQWWDDTWLNEALGEWMDKIITDTVEPSWRVRDHRAGYAAWAMGEDETLAVQAIRQPVTTDQGIQSSFDNSITYAKGSRVLGMFEAFATEPAWRGFIRDYIRKHAWGNASADDFFIAAKTSLGANIETGLRSFVEQPGVPKVSARVECKGNALVKIEVAQVRSLPTGVADPAPKTWRFPACLRFGTAKGGEAACVELSAATADFVPKQPTACPTWVIANAGANGYHRSVVEVATVRALMTPTSAVARAAKPTAAERMMLVADLQSAVQRGEHVIQDALALAPIVTADPDDRVALTGFELGSFRSDVFDDALYAKAEKFAHRSYAPRARQLGWKRGASDSDDRHRLRRALVPAVAKHEPTLVKQAVQFADAWLATKTGIDDEMVDAVLAVSVESAGQARFDQLLAAAKAARDRDEKRRILNALGGFKDPAIAAKALELVRGTEFDLRDTRGIMYRVLFRRETRKLGFAFVQQHIDELLARMRSDEAAGFLAGLAGSPCDPATRTAIAALVTPRAAKVDGAAAPVARGLEQANHCIAAIERQLPAIREFLARY
jgi:aminopeptidase N